MANGNYIAPASAVLLAVIPQSSGAGTFWFDDISISPTTNLVVNGGFEAGASEWSLGSQASVDTNPANAHSGNNSLKLVATAAWQGSTQFVPVTAGQTYSFSGWGRSSSAGGDFTLIGFDANWGQVGSHSDYSFSGSGAWVMAIGNYIAPATAVRVAVIPQSSGAGTFWFDDISLSPTSNLVVNGGFEAGATAWNLASQASIDANPADAHAGNNSLQLIAIAAWQGSTQFVPVTAAQSYTFSGWGRSTSAGGVFTLISFDANWNQVGPHVDFSFPASDTWTMATGTYIAPVNAVRVAVIPQSSGAGTFWFDDVTLAKQ